MLSRQALASLWQVRLRESAHREARAWQSPRRAQEEVLSRFLERNRDSAYGLAHGYATIESIEDYQNQVPIVSYDDLRPWVDRICAGENGVLTADPVLFVEGTSGSTGRAKYVPYTETLLAEFRGGIHAWLADLFETYPSILSGTQYWSISPLVRRACQTDGGVPIGIDNDLEYLDALGQRVLSSAMAVSPAVGELPDLASVQEATLETLKRDPELRFISVWSPTFLTLLLDQLEDEDPQALWPKLQVVSCWADGASAILAEQLQQRLPWVDVQGKGLLATEGIVTIPLSGRPAARPLLTGHFLEFVDGDGKARLIDELAVGARYDVVLTTGAGFARYALGDRVEVVAPDAIRFVGRAGQVSDLCGEKLGEVLVAETLQDTTVRGPFPGFALLAPETHPAPHYALYVDATEEMRAEVDAFAERVEARLRSSLHYDYCRSLGQLQPVRGVCVPNAESLHLARCVDEGQRAGDVKPPALDCNIGWGERFANYAHATH